jgi:hypothetical protein
MTQPTSEDRGKASLEDAILLALETRTRLRDRLSVNNARLGEALAQHLRPLLKVTGRPGRGGRRGWGALPGQGTPGTLGGAGT